VWHPECREAWSAIRSPTPGICTVPSPRSAPRIIRPLRDFLAAESAGAILLSIGAIAALVWANSPWSAAYGSLLRTDAGLAVGSWNFSLDLHGWVNDGLMAVFFLVVGLEIKRELIEGELARPQPGDPARSGGARRHARARSRSSSRSPPEPAT
jgi:hypothetical protein